jgi:hypothetical protein
MSLDHSDLNLATRNLLKKLKPVDTCNLCTLFHTEKCSLGKKVHPHALINCCPILHMTLRNEVMNVYRK